MPVEGKLLNVVLPRIIHDCDSPGKSHVNGCKIENVVSFCRLS